MSEHDLDLFKEKHLNIVTNPASNLKLASGIAPIQAMLQRKINICLGTDGPASNNCLDMFREMFLVTGLAKYKNCDASAVDAYEVLKMATVNGAKALNLNCGVLEAGKSADLIILDLMLPFISGDELIRNIRKFSDVPVIVVSAKSLTFNKVELLRLGADDYLTKPFDLDELLARIERNLLRSQKDTPNLCLTFGELSINTSSKIVTVADEIIVLTAKEYQLVELLAKYPDKVFSKQNLYESIWQEPFARDNDVINTHISNLRKKLKGEGCRIKTIWGLGYRFAK